MSLPGYEIRPASPTDEAQLERLLEASYGSLLAASYPIEVLARALPALATVNPQLMSCGTWYVAEADDGTLAACGGWTAREPGTSTRVPGLAHLRHFATHPDHVRRGLARALVERSVDEARSAGMTRMACLSTIAAEPFYAAMGFATTERVDVPISRAGHDEAPVAFPSISMHRAL